LRPLIWPASAVLMVGAVYGLVGVFDALSTSNLADSMTILLVAYATVLFVLTGAGAYLAMRGAPLGARLLILALLPQIIWLETPRLIYHATVGPYLFATVIGDTHAPLFGVGGIVTLRYGTPQEAAGLAVNLFAVALLVLFLVVRRDLRAV